MSKKANPAVVGGFTLVAAALAVAAVFLFGSGQFFTDTQKFVVHFEGSLIGLSEGSPVTFRGVQVGNVADMSIVTDLDDMAHETRIPVVIQVDLEKFKDPDTGRSVADEIAARPHETTNKLVESGLRAQLQVRSFVTGLLEVALDVRPGSPANLVGAGEPPYPEIPTLPSRMQELTRTLQDIPFEQLSQSLLDAADGVKDLATSEDLHKAIASSSKTTAQLEKLVTKVNKQSERVTQEVEKAVAEARSLMENVNKQVGPLATDMKDTLTESRQVMGRIEKKVAPALDKASKAAESAEKALRQAQKTLQTAETMARPGSSFRTRLNQMLSELAAAARSLRLLTDELERRPESLLYGKGGQ